MITEKELRKVNELRERKGRVKSLLDSFSSPYVWAKVGIVDINSASVRQPVPSEHAQFFHTEMKPLVDELSELVISKLQHEAQAIDLELSQYISIEP